MKLSSGRSTYRSLIILALMLVLSLIPTSASAAGPTLLTDLSDYEPGDTVTFRGSGFSWGEVVNLQAVGSTNGSQINSQATADIFGNIGGSFTLPIMFEATYTLTATGTVNGLVASTWFYDFVSAFNIIAPSSPVSVEAGKTQVYTILAKTQGNNPVPGIQVNWTATGGFMLPASTTTDARGNASSTYMAGSNAGSFVVTATAPGAGQNGNDKNSTQGVTIFIRDNTAPTINCTAPDPTVWYGDNVTVSCTASDLGSGLANPSDASFILATTVQDGNETASASTNSRQVCDNSNNCATAGAYTFKVDRKAPTFTCGAVPTTWSATDVSIACTASDGGSGLATPASFVLSTSVAGGTETASASTGTATVADNVGHSVTAGPITGIKVDKKAPTITCTAPNQTPWYADNVTVNCTAMDGGSGLANPADASFSLSTNVADGTETANAGTGNPIVKDAVNNGAVAGPYTYKVDRKAPTFTCGAAPTTWSATDVSIACTASDGGSGLATPASFSLSTSVAVGSETASASTGTATVTDNVGHSVTAGPITDIKVDKKAPTEITFVGGIVDGGSYYYGFVPAAPSCTAKDGGSGFASCVVSGFGTNVGSYKLTATAKDMVNNTSTATLSYTVLAWTLKGFYPPVDMSTTTGIVWNTVKNGSTVPLKFEIFAGATELTDTAFVKQPLTATSTTCGTGLTDDIDVLATGNTLLRYDTTAGQFIYNWQTPKTAGACIKVTVATLDGSSLSANFMLK